MSWTCREVRPDVVRDISISRDQLELFSLSEKERNIVFCPPFGLQLLIFASLDRGDEIVAEKQKMVDCFFFSLGEQQVNVLLQKSEQLACDD